MLRSIKKRLSRNNSNPLDDFERHESAGSTTSSASSLPSTPVQHRKLVTPRHQNRAASIKLALQSVTHKAASIPPAPDLSVKIEHLKNFDACIEAADAQAASGGEESKVLPLRLDTATGLSDCSVLISPDGDLLLVPQTTSDVQDLFRPRRASSPSLKASDDTPTSLFSELMLHGKDDYESAVFLGHDLHADGDRALNGFSARGWSIPATTAALQQTEQSLQDLRHFCEQLVLAKKDAAARTAAACDQLRSRQPSMGGQAPASTVIANDWEIIEPSRSNDFELTHQRVGPLLMPGSTLNAATVALEKYHSTMAEREGERWRAASLQRKGLLPQLRADVETFAERAAHRQRALDETSARARQMEMRLQALIESAQLKWDAVYQAEHLVTQKVQVIMAERSREREMQRMAKLHAEEERRAAEADKGQLGATSEEIWSIVSEVADSMEHGSFEPMDVPETPLTESAGEAAAAENKDAAPESAPEEPGSPSTLPMASREVIEHEVGLPELRSAAMAADEDIADAADALMNVLTTLDTTRRSARVAAETCLVSAGNAQARCIRELIKAERASLEEQLRELNALDEVIEKIDVRADLDAYISADKKERGGSSRLGDDDDGGLASALAILSRHVDGSMGSDPVHRMSVDSTDSTEQDGAPSETIDEAIDKIFTTVEPPAKEFEESIDWLCKAAREAGPAARTKRSTMCYTLNAKRSTHAEILSRTQFDGLCRLFCAILEGCNAEAGGVSNAKMCIMLAQTFYIPDEGQESGGDGEEENDRQARIYVKNELKDHPLWSKDDFWDEALSQQISESLTHSGVMANFEKSRQSGNSQQRKKSEWTQTRKTKWYDLNHMERMEAASQVQAVVFAQLGALAHSMLELGCGLERSCAFARRMAIRHQLPSSQRTMLLQHLLLRDGAEKQADLTTASS